MESMGNDGEDISHLSKRRADDHGDLFIVLDIQEYF